MRNIKILAAFLVLTLGVFSVHAALTSAADTTKTVCVGQPSTLSWSSTNISGACSGVTNDALHCNFSPSPNVAGSKTVSLSSGSCSSSITCDGVTETATLVVDTTKVWDSAASVCVTPVTCATGQAYIGGSCVNCSNGGCTGGPGTPTYPLGPTTSPLVCSNGAIDPPTCTPPVVSLSINATPNRIRSGGSTTVTWDSTNALSCAVTRNGAAWATGLSSPVGGKVDTNLTSQTTYVLTCQTSGSPATQSAKVVVDIAPSFNEF